MTTKLERIGEEKRIRVEWEEKLTWGHEGKILQLYQESLRFV